MASSLEPWAAGTPLPQKNEGPLALLPLPMLVFTAQCQRAAVAGPPSSELFAHVRPFGPLHIIPATPGRNRGDHPPPSRAGCDDSWSRLCRAGSAATAAAKALQQEAGLSLQKSAALVAEAEARAAAALATARAATDRVPLLRVDAESLLWSRCPASAVWLAPPVPRVLPGWPPCATVIPLTVRT